MKHYFNIVLVVFISSTSIFGQDQVRALIKGSGKDAGYLLKEFMTPALQVTGAGLNQGWFNTAATHKKFGFDITVSSAFVSVPEADLSFKVDNAQLTDVQLINPANGTVPTYLGSDQVSQQFRLKSDQNATFTAEGANIKDNTAGFAPVPIIQAGIGLPKGNELKVRFLPAIDISSTGIFENKTRVSLIGVGLVHDIKQHIPVISQLPFDLSALVGYSKYTVESELDKGVSTNVSRYETSAFTVQGLVSKKFSILTLYGSVGYNFASAKMEIKGAYKDAPTTSNPNPKTINGSDIAPINVSSSGPRATAGFRLKLLIFTLHADYTLQEFSTITTGLGLSIR